MLFGKIREEEDPLDWTVELRAEGLSDSNCWS